MKNLTRTMVFAVALLALTACAQLGLTRVPDFRESALLATNLVGEVQNSALTALVAKKISSADAENVVKTADLSMAGINIARTVQASSGEAAGQAKLKAVVVVLTGLQAYLATQTGAQK